MTVFIMYAAVVLAMLTAVAVAAMKDTRLARAAAQAEAARSRLWE
jgi:hypothetical protein